MQTVKTYSPNTTSSWFSFRRQNIDAKYKREQNLICNNFRKEPEVKNIEIPSNQTKGNNQNSKSKRQDNHHLR